MARLVRHERRRRHGDGELRQVRRPERQRTFDAIVADLAAGKPAERKTHRLRDWASAASATEAVRFPSSIATAVATMPVPDDQLPVVLPEDRCRTAVRCVAKMPEFTKPLARAALARRETDTMDTFVESSWYFARYASPDCTTGNGGRAAPTTG